MLGETVRTDAAKKKWLSDKAAKERVKVDAWGRRGELIDRVAVAVRVEGVDGTRFARSQGVVIEGPAKLKIDDGESPITRFETRY